MISPEENPQERVATEILSLILDFHVIMKIAVPNLTGIQEAKYRLLGILESGDSLSMTDLCNQMFISKPYMTRLVDSLVSEGSIERHPDAKDRRVINITITDEGRTSLRVLFMNMRNYLKPFMSDFSSDDLRRICTASKELHTTFLKNPSFMNSEGWSFYTSHDHPKNEER